MQRLVLCVVLGGEEIFSCVVILKKNPRKHDHGLPFCNVLSKSACKFVSLKPKSVFVFVGDC